MRNESVNNQIKAALEIVMSQLNKLACNAVISMWQFDETIRMKIFNEYFLKKSIQLVKSKLSRNISNLAGMDDLIKTEILTVFNPLKKKEITEEIAENFLTGLVKQLGISENLKGGQIGRFLVITNEVLETIYDAGKKEKALEASIKKTMNYLNGLRPEHKLSYKPGIANIVVKRLKFTPILAFSVAIIPIFLCLFLLFILVFRLPPRYAFMGALALTTALGLIRLSTNFYDNYREFILSTTLRDLLIAAEKLKKQREIFPQESEITIKKIPEPNDAPLFIPPENNEKDPYYVDAHYMRKNYNEAPTTSYIACLSQVVRDTAPKTVVWQYNQAVINFPSEHHTIIPLWTAKPGQKYRNNKYFILWDGAYRLLQEFDPTVQEKTVNKALLGKICKAEQEEGWVDCSIEMAQELRQKSNAQLISKPKAFKLKLLGTKGGKHRIGFFPIAESNDAAQEDKKILLGNPVLKTH